MSRIYPKKKCPRCGKRVMICITARSSAPGETRTHNCPHGKECYDGSWCEKCEDAMAEHNTEGGAMKSIYPKKYCPRCGKLVQVCVTGRSSAPGETRWHKCPHGVVCTSDDAGCEKCAPLRTHHELTSLQYDPNLPKVGE